MTRIESRKRTRPSVYEGGGDEGEVEDVARNERREREKEKVRITIPFRPLSVSSTISSFSSAPLLLPFIRVPTFPQAESNQYFGKVRGRSIHACGSRHRRCTLRKFNCTALLSGTRTWKRIPRQALCLGRRKERS